MAVNQFIMNIIGICGSITAVVTMSTTLLIFFAERDFFRGFYYGIAVSAVLCALFIVLTIIQYKGGNKDGNK